MNPSSSNTRTKIGVAIALPIMMLAIIYGCGTDKPPAGDGQVNIANEKCGDEGATQACHEQAGVSANGIRICRHGERVCKSGSWSACGAVGTSTIEALSTGTNPDLGKLSRPNRPLQGVIGIRAGDANAPGCNNPCDPDCLGYDYDAGPLTLDASADTALLGPLPATVGGFVAKLLQNGHCERYPGAASGSGQAAISCQADFFCHFHCDVGPCSPDSKDCEKFPDAFDPVLGTHAGQIPNQAAISCDNAAPDLTLGSPCKIPLTGQVSVAICNRGSAPVLTGQTLSVAVLPPAGTLPLGLLPIANIALPGDQSNCPVHGTDCTKVLTADLLPGQCTRIDETTCPGLNGNKIVYVNPGREVTECVFRSNYTLTPAPNFPDRHGPTGSAPQPPYPNATYPGEQNFQLGCSNNYHAWNSSAMGFPDCPLPYSPKVITIQQNADCPPGYGARWNKFGWNSDVPSTTEILFDVRVRDRLYDGGVGAWSAWIPVGWAATSPARDPGICMAAGVPSPTVGNGVCMKDLFAMLEAAGPNQAEWEEMEIRVTMNPSSPAATVAPTLYSIAATYQCIANE